jgi:hypothetical protein
MANIVLPSKVCESLSLHVGFVGLSWALKAYFKNVKKIARVKTMFNQPVANFNNL